MIIAFIILASLAVGFFLGALALRWALTVVFSTVRL